MTATRGTTNRNVRGNTVDRLRRRQYLVDTYRADVDIVEEAVIYGSRWIATGPPGEGTPTCRCYRCGGLLTVDTVTVDRIVPGVKGGTYRRSNIRPACGPCNSETGGALAGKR
jgi:hypothetical protein